MVVIPLSGYPTINLAVFGETGSPAGPAGVLNITGCADAIKERAPTLAIFTLLG